MTAEQLREDVDRHQPRLLSDDEIVFDPDWENEPERAGLQRWCRSASGGYAFSQDDLAYIAALPPNLRLPYFESAVKWFGSEVAHEGAQRMEIEPDEREFLSERIDAFASADNAEWGQEEAIEFLPADELEHEEREAVEAVANKLRAVGPHVSVGRLSGNPFAAWEERQRASIDSALHIEAISWNLTLDAIHALPTFRARSSTGQHTTPSRRSKSSPGRDPDRPREPLSAAERQTLADAVARERIAREDEARAHTSETNGLRQCQCGCGPFLPTRKDQLYKNAGCRKRAQRQREKP